VDRLLELRLVSGRSQPLASCTLAIDNTDGRTGSVDPGTLIAVGLGDRTTALRPVFAGQIDRSSPSHRLELEARDQMLQLHRLTVTRQWLRVTPQEVARQLVREAGVQATIYGGELPRRHAVVSAGRTALQVLQDMAATWGLDWDLYCDGMGAIWWGPWDESPRARQSIEAGPVTYRYGEDLLELEPAEDGERGRARCKLSPEIEHSTVCLLADSRYWQRRMLARIEQVRHYVGEAGSHTEFYWSPLI